MGDEVDMSDDLKWLTYDEAAELLGIKADSVRRRAAARKWPRRVGNDRKSRVGIPPDVIPERIHETTPNNPDYPDTSPQADLSADLAAARAKIEGLEARLADTQADRDAWRQQAERLASEARPIGIIERIFGRR